MGHIAHLRKQFKSINIWLYHNVAYEKKKNDYLHYENLMVLYLNNLKYSSPKDALCQIWLQILTL